MPVLALPWPPVTRGHVGRPEGRISGVRSAAGSHKRLEEPALVVAGGIRRGVDRHSLTVASLHQLPTIH
jgi:hypothetical protein